MDFVSLVLNGSLSFLTEDVSVISGKNKCFVFSFLSLFYGSCSSDRDSSSERTQADPSICSSFVSGSDVSFWSLRRKESCSPQPDAGMLKRFGGLTSLDFNSFSLVRDALSWDLLAVLSVRRRRVTLLVSSSPPSRRRRANRTLPLGKLDPRAA